MQQFPPLKWKNRCLELKRQFDCRQYLILQDYSLDWRIRKRASKHSIEKPCPQLPCKDFLSESPHYNLEIYLLPDDKSWYSWITENERFSYQILLLLHRSLWAGCF